MSRLASVVFNYLQTISLGSSGLRNLHWKVRYYYDGSAFIYDLVFPFCSFQYPFFVLVSIMWCGEFLFWSYFGVLYASCTSDRHLFPLIWEVFYWFFGNFFLCFLYLWFIGLAFSYCPRIPACSTVYFLDLIFSLVEWSHSFTLSSRPDSLCSTW